MNQFIVPAFSVLIRFWLNRENNSWQGELREISGNRAIRFNGQPELIQLLNELLESSK